MTYEIFLLITLFGAVLAGLLGSLTGLGGGVIIIPLLTLVLGVDLHYAIGASLVSVIATSSGSAVAYVKEGISNIRIGMFLEIATTIGAICGAFLAMHLPANSIAVIFGILLFFSIIMSLKKKEAYPTEEIPGSWAKKLKLNGTYPTATGPQPYAVKNVFGGFSVMWMAGIFSGLLGIGSGALKVLAMDNVMKMPFKVSTTTSNFMIGVTAAASAVIYFQNGYILPQIAGPVMIGVLIGAMLGSRLLMKMKTKWIKWIFAIVVSYLGAQMIYEGFMGNF